MDKCINSSAKHLNLPGALSMCKNNLNSGSFKHSWKPRHLNTTKHEKPSSYTLNMWKPKSYVGQNGWCFGRTFKLGSPLSWHHFRWPYSVVLVYLKKSSTAKAIVHPWQWVSCDRNCWNGICGRLWPVLPLSKPQKFDTTWQTQASRVFVLNYLMTCNAASLEAEGTPPVCIFKKKTSHAQLPKWLEPKSVLESPLSHVSHRWCFQNLGICRDLWRIDLNC